MFSSETKVLKRNEEKLHILEMMVSKHSFETDFFFFLRQETLKILSCLLEDHYSFAVTVHIPYFFVHLTAMKKMADNPELLSSGPELSKLTFPPIFSIC